MNESDMLKEKGHSHMTTTILNEHSFELPYGSEMPLPLFQKSTSPLLDKTLKLLKKNKKLKAHVLSKKSKLKYTPQTAFKIASKKTRTDLEKYPSLEKALLLQQMPLLKDLSVTLRFFNSLSFSETYYQRKEAILEGAHKEISAVLPFFFLSQVQTEAPAFLQWPALPRIVKAEVITLYLKKQLEFIYNKGTAIKISTYPLQDRKSYYDPFLDTIFINGFFDAQKKASDQKSSLEQTLLACQKAAIYAYQYNLVQFMLDKTDEKALSEFLPKEWDLLQDACLIEQLLSNPFSPRKALDKFGIEKQRDILMAYGAFPLKKDSEETDYIIPTPDSSQVLSAAQQKEIFDFFHQRFADFILFIDQKVHYQFFEKLCDKNHVSFDDFMAEKEKNSEIPFLAKNLPEFKEKMHIYAEILAMLRMMDGKIIPMKSAMSLGFPDAKNFNQLSDDEVYSLSNYPAYMTQMRFEYEEMTLFMNNFRNHIEKPA
ncbi:MAG: hypothetical protein ACTSXQ_07330 [Alphaproteobacteria bacterium]